MNYNTRTTAWQGSLRGLVFHAYQEVHGWRGLLIAVAGIWLASEMARSF